MTWLGLGIMVKCRGLCGQVQGLCGQVQRFVWSSACVCVHHIFSYLWASGQVGGVIFPTL
jgi:hypothetical protein